MRCLVTVDVPGAIDPFPGRSFQSYKALFDVSEDYEIRRLMVFEALKL